MLKSLSGLEFQIADKVYHFVCDPNSPIEHIKEVLFQFQKYIGQVEDNLKAQMVNQQQQQQQQEGVPSETVVPVADPQSQVNNNEENHNDQPPV